LSFSSLSNFYISSEWRTFRKNFISERLARDGEIIDEYTGKPILESYDIILHHKEHLTEQNVKDFSISLNPDNIMIVSHVSHNKIHEKFVMPVKRVYLVFGPPSSGKISYIESIAEVDDLIIDIDRIYDAININRSKKVFDIVMNIYNEMLDTVTARKGRWKNAYITSSTLHNVERIERATGAELVYVDTPLEECLKRGQDKIKMFGQPYEDVIYKFFEDWNNTYKVLLQNKL
jgi:predicted kinase